jgi:hypothetical protein
VTVVPHRRGRRVDHGRLHRTTRRQLMDHLFRTARVLAAVLRCCHGGT